MRVQVCTSDMLRITKSINSSFRSNEKWMVVKYDFEAIPYEVQPLAQGAALLTEALTLQISDSPWLIKVLDRVTGRVVVGLHARTDAEKAACGWWRIVATPKPGIVASNEYWTVGGYAFTNGTAVTEWEKRWRKVQPVKYSRLSIYMALKELGKWDAAEAFMRANGLYEPFMFAQEISSDHPQFIAVKAQVAEALGLTIEQVDALLKECVLK